MVVDTDALLPSRVLSQIHRDGSMGYLRFLVVPISQPYSLGHSLNVHDTASAVSALTAGSMLTIDYLTCTLDSEPQAPHVALNAVEFGTSAQR